MDFAPHECAESAVYELVAREGAQARELVGDNARGEVRLVVRSHLDLGAGKSRADQPCNFFWAHWGILHGHSVRAPIMTSMTVHPAGPPAAAAPDDDELIASAHRALAIEERALAALAARVGADFAQACHLCLGCHGRVVVTGMGKSGHIAGKIAATLASTGTPAFFMHPAEAGHGDLGMITRTDVVLALSNSGETPEVVALLPALKRLGVPLIVMTGKSDSTLARAANVALDVAVAEEACPLNLAPTASTTATLAMGDALAVAVLEARGFTAQDFARSHPGGTLGRQLLLHVDDLMRTGAALPRVPPDAPLSAGLLEMSAKGLGMTVVVDANERILGVFTDGDLRRVLEARSDMHGTTMSAVMTANPKTIGPRELAAEAVHLMELYRITALPVADAAGRLVGALNVHDLFRARVM
jgi:arabinose-5-phosphate isomerase